MASEVYGSINNSLCQHYRKPSRPDLMMLIYLLYGLVVVPLPTDQACHDLVFYCVKSTIKRYVKAIAAFPYLCFYLVYLL